MFAVALGLLHLLSDVCSCVVALHLFCGVCSCVVFFHLFCGVCSYVGAFPFMFSIKRFGFAVDSKRLRHLVNTINSYILVFWLSQHNR